MSKIGLGRRGLSSAEDNPFWISYADLMTAAMIMFMAIMAITLTLIGEKALDSHDSDKQGAGQPIMQTLSEVLGQYPGVKVDVKAGVIDVGEMTRFERGQSTLRAEGSAELRQLIREVLAQQVKAPADQLIKNIVVEGYADQDGSYLYNLSLSLNRSKNVVCALLDDNADQALTDLERDTLRRLLMVGGFSSNSLRDSKASSRRVELKIVVGPADTTLPVTPQTRAIQTPIGTCGRAL